MPAQAPRRLLEAEHVADVMVVRFCVRTIRDDGDIMDIFGQLDQLVIDGCGKMVLSFRGIDSIASYAIGRLVGLNQKLTERGGTLLLCDLTPIVAEIVDLMRLNRKLKIYKDEQKAIQAF